MRRYLLIFLALVAAAFFVVWQSQEIILAYPLHFRLFWLFACTIASGA